MNDSPNRAILSTIVIKELSGFTLLEKSLQTHIVLHYYLESVEPGDESKSNKTHTEETQPDTCLPFQAVLGIFVVQSGKQCFLPLRELAPP